MRFSEIRSGLLLYDDLLITYAEALKFISDDNLKHPLYIMSKYKNDWYSPMSAHKTKEEKEEKPKEVKEVPSPLPEWEEVEVNIDSVQAKIRCLPLVPYGGDIPLRENVGPYTILNRTLRYFIATRSLKSGSMEYLIFDTVEGVCGPYVMPSIPYAMDLNLHNPTNRVKILDDLESGKLCMTGNIKIADVVDLDSAMKNIPVKLGWP